MVVIVHNVGERTNFSALATLIVQSSGVPGITGGPLPAAAGRACYIALRGHSG